MSLFVARPQRRLKPPGPPPVPTAFEYLIGFIGDLTTTKNYTWTAPEDGWYKIFGWGRSGNGGNGDRGYRLDNTYWIAGIGGGGGSVGGFFASLIYLLEGEQIPIAILTSVTKVGTDGSELFMSATAGGNANYNKPTAGGTAIGGNIANLSGAVGGTGGGAGSYNNGNITQGGSGQQGGNNGALPGSTTSSTSARAYGGAGSGGARAMGEEYCKYVAPNMVAYKGGNGVATPTVGSSMPTIISGPNIVITGAGCGGGGGNTTNAGAVVDGAAGGPGQPGVVIIEKGVA